MERFKSIDYRKQGSNLLRYYGGQYDSYKQYKIMELIRKDCNYQHGVNIGKQPDSDKLIDIYKARLKYDILFTRRVVITDSQYMDGIFWQSLVNNEEERNGFFNFLNKFDPEESPVEFRFRKATVESSFIQFFRNGGVFSSFVDWKTSEKFGEAVKEAIKHESKLKTEMNFKQWISIIERNLDNEGKNKLLALIGYIEVLKKLTPPKLSSTYDQKTYYDFVKLAGYQHHFGTLFDNLPINEDINDLLQSIDDQFDITKPLKPDRKVTIKKVNELKAKYDGNSEIISTLDAILGKVSNVYNNAIAIQHGCNAIDEGVVNPKDIQFCLKKDGPRIELNPIDLNAGLTEKNIRYLSKQSWKDFYHLLQDPKIAKLRFNWFSNVLGIERLNPTIIEDLVKIISTYESNTEVTRPKFRITAEDVFRGAIIPIGIKAIGDVALLLSGGSTTDNLASSSQTLLTHAVATSGAIVTYPMIRYITSSSKYLNKDETNLVNIAHSNIASMRY